MNRMMRDILFSVITVVLIIGNCYASNSVDQYLKEYYIIGYAQVNAALKAAALSQSEVRAIKTVNGETIFTVEVADRVCDVKVRPASGFGVAYEASSVICSDHKQVQNK